MNINLVCVAKTNKGRQQLSERSGMAINYLQGIFGETGGHIYEQDHVVLYNSDRQGTWSVPTWLSTSKGILSFSQPPLPVNQEVDSQSWANVVQKIVVDQGRFDLFAINHFGSWLSPQGELVIWTDFLGFGRCYIVETEDHLAISNHIGALAYFAGEPLTLDDQAIGNFSIFGWFSATSTPYTQIRRVSARARIRVDRHGHVEHGSYLDLKDLVGARDGQVNFEDTIDQTRTLAQNLGHLSVGVPTVYLSGGQDSRMTAGLWLTGGNSANVVTLGTLQPEVDIAEQLLALLSETVDLEAQGVSHRITRPTPSSVTMPLDERLKVAFSMWDGDAAPTNMKTNVRVPNGRARLSIGGTNGEITHGYFYSRPGLADAILRLDHPLKRLETVYGGKVPTAHSKSGLIEFFNDQYEDAAKAGQSGLGSLDVFYLNEKLRRWHNQSLNTSSTVLLGTPAYVRAAFDLTIQEKIDKVAPKTIARLAVPQWNGVRYYKAVAGESKVANVQGLRTWNIDREYFYEQLDNPQIWDTYLSPDLIGQYRDMVDAGEAVGSHESWFNRAIWIDYIPSHMQELNRRVRKDLSTAGIDA